jgi:capsular exopolysaccharide synthesis family protein
LGVALGLLIGIGLAFLWEALDSTVRSVDEVEQTLGLPVLGRIAPPSYENPRGVEVAIASHGPAVEAFRQLRTNLEYANRDLGAHAIMITSALPREGKSRTIVNLAAAVASMGERVVLIDLDLRQPALHRFAQIPNKAGAVDVIRGTSTLQEGLVNVPFSPSNNDGRKLTSGVLRILPAGQLGSHDPTRILAPDILRRLLDGLREKTDVILIDTPPMLAVADAAIISSAVDAVLVVTRMGMVPRQALRELGRALDRTSAPRLGFVATGTDDAGTYGYGQYTAAPPLAAAS